MRTNLLHPMQAAELSAVGGGDRVPSAQGAEQTLLARQAARESNARSYPRGLPLAIERAFGTEVFSVDGRRYLDFFAGAGVLALGHNHPKVVEAVQEQLQHLVHALDFPTPIRDRFVGALIETLPPELRGSMRVHLCAPTGSDAVEAAIKLCRRATGRVPILAFHGAYHGMTAGALSVTSLSDLKGQCAGLMPEAHFTPYSYCHRCPMGLQRPHCGTACGTLFERVLTDSHSGVPKPAAVVMEMVQGEGGSVVPEADFVQQVRRATAEAQVPLVADEIQAGFGRTGRFYAFEHFGVAPDVITLSKALGGIGLPIAAIMYREELDVWEPGAHIGTFRGHQLAMAAGLAALEVMAEERLVEQAEERGRQFQAGLRAIRSPWISEVRGLGLMLGMELSDPATGAPATAMAKAVRKGCFDRGLLIELGGRDDGTLRFLPPLNVTSGALEEALQILVDAFAALPDPV